MGSQVQEEECLGEPTVDVILVQNMSPLRQILQLGFYGGKAAQVRLKDAEMCYTEPVENRPSKGLSRAVVSS